MIVGSVCAQTVDKNKRDNELYDPLDVKINFAI